MTTDENERHKALDPMKSFIVQAPAGSGKTELLTQRFLVLLSRVKEPEEILAITFTKKSAAEMRTRIIHALQMGKSGNAPERSHAKKTYQLAKAVLKRDATCEWHILKNPNRLRIQTIDSFNAYLTRQLPILSHFGATPEISNDYFALYREATHEFLTHLEENLAWSEQIAQLLVHMDNDLNKVADLLIHMLSKRDQWLPYITLNTNDSNLRKTLEKHLVSITEEILSQLAEAFPLSLKSEMVFLASFAGQNLKRTDEKDKNESIVYCADIAELPSACLKDKNIWLGIAELLLNKNNEWRKRIDKTIGFPPLPEFKPIKKRFLSLLESFYDNEKLKTALIALRESPTHYYETSQWKTLEALHQVLQVAVAQLKVVFQSAQKIDYIESAEGALNALGTQNAPTDLTLALDYQIQHILIDEFQDTSNTQYRLIERLTMGWQKDDARTLFVVGDPMQSIYRFREAEVGLFIRARKLGLGHIKLEPITLSQNFRSTSEIVNWVNEHFKQILPRVDDINLGAVSYSPSIANQSSCPGNEGLNPEEGVQLYSFSNSNDEAIAESIIDLIASIKARNEKKSIAILVRSRSHLTSIIFSLKKANIPYRAIEIDPLDSRIVIQDLMSLTRALLSPADRIAWLSILRAPWIGLTLDDLLILSKNPNKNIWETLQTETLSIDGQKRVQRIIPILKSSIDDRERFPFRQWIENTWLALGGPEVLSDLNDLEDASAYFHLLEKENFHEVYSLEKLTDAVSQLYASPNQHADDSLQIMTIHNSKGLEFDVVILPHLEKRPPVDEKQLLLWMALPRHYGENALILAPIHAVGEDKDSIYEYIKRQHALKNDYEMGRLLYVAVTREKKELHIFFKVEENENDTIRAPSKSLLEKLLPALSSTCLSSPRKQGSLQRDPCFRGDDRQIGNDMVAENAREVLNNQGRKLYRLTSAWENPIKINLIPSPIAYHHQTDGFCLPDNTAKCIGILIHAILQQMSNKGFTWWMRSNTETKTKYIKHQLRNNGLPYNVFNCVWAAIENTLQDSRGRWILEAKNEAHTEFGLTLYNKDTIHVLSIDKTFVDEGTRWIIDYKTSHPENMDLTQFLNAEKEKYQEKMFLYQSAMGKFDLRPIRLGLYFPLISAWCEW